MALLREDGAKNSAVARGVGRRVKFNKYWGDKNHPHVVIDSLWGIIPRKRSRPNPSVSEFLRCIGWPSPDIRNEKEAGLVSSLFAHVKFEITFLAKLFKMAVVYVDQKPKVDIRPCSILSVSLTCGWVFLCQLSKFLPPAYPHFGDTASDPAPLPSF